MARYYFDTSDGDWRFDDPDGEEMAGAEAVRRAVLVTLPELARDTVLHGVPDDRRRVFQARVRDETGTVVYVASLTLVGEWCVTPP